MRKWTYLVAALLMAGATTTFTGCIDNDEPGSIEVLRTAKAELLRAKIAVETANAALINAQAETEKANAAKVQAEAAVVEAQAELARLNAELKAAQNEAEKATLKMQIAQAEQTLEENALRHQQIMVDLQQKLAESQAAYELALKQIAIAQATLSDSEKLTLGALKLKVDAAQSKVDEAAEKVAEEEENYYKVVVGLKKDTIEYKNLELKIANAKEELVKEETTLAQFKEFLAKDTETADWRKEVAALEDSIAKLEDERAAVEVEVAKLWNAEEFKTLKDAKDEAIQALEDLNIGSSKIEQKIYKNGQKDYKQTVDADTKVADAMNLIGGDNGKKGFIKEVNDLIAGYTSQKKALLDEVAEATSDMVDAAKEDYEKAVEAWKTAKDKYLAAADYNAADALKAVAAAEKTYNEALAKAEAITDGDLRAAAKAAAYNAYAAALVTYYTNADKYVDCTTNEVTLSIYDPTGTSKPTKKTVLAWLSDATYSGVYLKQIMDTQDWSSADFYGTKAIKSMGDRESLLATLQGKSVAAFGEASLYGKEYANIENGYMRVEPTQAELKAVGYENAGAAGTYYKYSDADFQYEAQNYKAIIENYEAVVKFWTEKYASLSAELAAAKDAKDAAVDAFNEYCDDINLYRANSLNDIDGRLRAMRAIKNALTGAINALLPDDYTYAGTVEFEKWLNDQVKNAEEAVIEAEKTVADAEIELELAKDGKYDKLSKAKEALDKATAKLTKAQAELAEATANLEKGLAIMAGKAE